MKRTSQHAFEPEEIMAYLDGELPAREAAGLASHLEHCGECQAIAAQMRQVSERLLDFQVEPCPARVDEVVSRVAEDKPSEPAAKPSLHWKPPHKRTLRVLAWVGGFAAVLIAVAFLLIPLMPERESRRRIEFSGQTTTSSLAGNANGASRLQAYAKIQSAPSSNGPAAPVPAPPFAKAQGIGGAAGGVDFVTRRGTNAFAGGSPMAGRDAEAMQLQGAKKSEAPVVQGPMIVQTASITILAPNYGEASKAIQQITREHGGYVENLNADTQLGAARSLSATLRVPEKQLDSCLADLRKLGHVEQEWRNNQEITDQYIDLRARLRNARAEEQRILQLLNTQTGRLSDVLEAERELARVRGEIESMDGQRAYMEHQVSYATVQVQLNEEYRAQLNPEAFSTGTRIRNSLVEGFRNLGDGVVALVIFVFAYGPSILFWLALLGAAGWFVWTRFRRGRTRA